MGYNNEYFVHDLHFDEFVNTTVQFTIVIFNGHEEIIYSMYSYIFFWSLSTVAYFVYYIANVKECTDK